MVNVVIGGHTMGIICMFGMPVGYRTIDKTKNDKILDIIKEIEAEINKYSKIGKAKKETCKIIPFPRK